MKYAPPPDGDLANPNRSYMDANPSAGVKGSIIPAAAAENVQREILAVIIAAGLTPDEVDLTQLKQAIALIAGSSASGNYKDAEILTANRVLTAADSNKYFSIGANNITITLPNPATMTKGMKFAFDNPSFTGCTLVASSGDVLDISSAVSFTSTPILTKNKFEIVNVSNTRFHISTNVQASLIAANGYIRFGNKAIMQWGKINMSTVANGFPISFPMSFPNAAFVIVTTADQTPSGKIEVAGYSVLTLTGVNLTLANSDSTTTTGDVSYFVIGN